MIRKVEALGRRVHEPAAFQQTPIRSHSMPEPPRSHFDLHVRAASFSHLVVIGMTLG
jgi:hypothetical protein